MNRTVLSLHLPIKPDWVDANRAARLSGLSLSAFVREAMREKVQRTFSPSADDTPTDLAA